MEKFKKLYFKLQTELDKLDCLRKNWTYFTLKREEFLKTIATPEFDTCDCDCMNDEPIIKGPLYRIE